MWPIARIPSHRAIHSPVTLFHVRDLDEESWSARICRGKTPGCEGHSIDVAHRVFAEDAIALVGIKRIISNL
jgi:hypothetical protein